MSIEMKALFVLLGLAVVFVFFGLVMAIRQGDEFTKECQAAGGIPQRNLVCIKRDSVIPLS